MTTTDKLIAEVRRLDAAAPKSIGCVGPYSEGAYLDSGFVLTEIGAHAPDPDTGDFDAAEPLHGPRHGLPEEVARLAVAFRTAAPALADAVEARDCALDALGQFTRTLLIEKAKLLPQSADTMLRAHFGLEFDGGKWRIRET